MVGVAASDWFGHSVALSADGNQVAASAAYNDDMASDSGHVRVFQYEANSGGTSTTGQWSQEGATSCRLMDRLWRVVRVNII